MTKNSDALAIKSLADGVDHVATEMENEWGVGRLRLLVGAGDGAMKPGRNGLNVLSRLLPELVAALRQAEAEARAAGLIEGDVDEDHAAELTVLDAG